MKNTLIFTIAIIIASGSGFALQKYLNQPTTQTYKKPAVDIQRPEFAAPDLGGKMRNIKEWDGKLIFLNFWATWCPPCKHEIPTFIELQKTYRAQDFQIIGIAIDEADAVREYAEKIGMNYPTLVAPGDGVMLSKRYGNGVGALPYTVIINRNGEISDTITGELSKIRAEKLLKKHGINL